MEKNTSRLWIDGPGQLTMMVEQDMNGQPVARPQPLDILWQGSMAFQGNSVVFQRTVTVHTQTQTLNTEKLEAMFDKPIDFSNPAAAQTGRPEDRPQLAHVRCYGRAFLKSQQFDEHGEQTSADDMNVLDLSINRVSGDIAGRGPGSVTRVSIGSGRAVPTRPAPAGRSRRRRRRRPERSRI